MQDGEGYGLRNLKKYIGVPFLDGGRDPSVGLDCWGLFLLVEKEFGISVPDFTIPCDDAESISPCSDPGPARFGPRIKRPAQRRRR